MVRTDNRKKHKEEISAWLTAYAERNDMTMDEMANTLHEYLKDLPLICVIKAIREK